MKILVRATNWIGDAVMSLPALRAIRQRFPGAEIAILAKPWVSALYDRERSIDRVIPLQGESGARDWKKKSRLIRDLRAEAFDLGVLLPNSFESAAVLRLAGVKRIVGYARDGRGFLLTDSVPVPRPGEIPEHERFCYLELLRRAGILDRLPDVSEVRLDCIEQRRAKGEELFRMLGVKLPVIGISPGAAFGSAKRWLPERFAETALKLAERMGASIAVFGSNAEKDLCDRVAEASGGRSFAATTALAAFIEMTAACSLFLTNDSGAMHIASALGIPTVTVFGPTNEKATGPLGSAALVIRQPVDCAPCGLRECPIDHRCMTGVTVDRVIEQVVALNRW